MARQRSSNEQLPHEMSKRADGDASYEPTLLRVLVIERHWQKYTTFERQFRRAAWKLAEEQGEPELRRATVSPRQFERWYAGTVKTEPYPDACRILEYMFGYSIKQLLGPATATKTRDKAVAESDDMDVVDSSSAIEPTASSLLFPPSDGASEIVEGNLEEAISALRHSMNESFDTSVPQHTVENWHYVADSYGRAYRITPPFRLLIDISKDLAELHALTNRRLPGEQYRALCHAAARMAGLLATTLINLDNYREARLWFHTATRAAEKSEDNAVQAWVLVRQAVSALYWGDPWGSVELVHRAEQLARNSSCIAAAWAPAVRARALAQIGDAEAARTALHKAEAAYTHLEARPHEQYAYGYTAAQLHFYRSNTLTILGDKAAYEAQDAALAHYSSREYLDPSLIHIDHMLCLARDGEAEEAADYARKFITNLPPQHRSPIILSRARELTALPALRKQLLALPATDGHELKS